MADDITLGKILLSKGSTPPTNTTTITATALEDSSEGSVLVDIGGEAVPIDVIGSVSEGEEVVVNVSNLSPIGTGVVGWGDSVNEKTQHITFVPSGLDAGLHIHENASSYNTDGDLHLSSGGVEIRNDGEVGASFTETELNLGANSVTGENIGDTSSVSISMLNAGLIDITTSFMPPFSEGDLIPIEAYYQFLRLDCEPNLDSEESSIEGGGVMVAAESVFTENAYFNKSLLVDRQIYVRNGIEIDGAISCADEHYQNWLPGTPGQVLTSQGAGLPPKWAAGGGGGGLSWQQIAQTTGGNSASLDLSGYSTVLIVADVLRNSAHHFFSATIPVAQIDSAAEYKLGGYVGTSLSAASGGAWVSMSSTSFAGVGSYINGTSYLTSTTWTVYGAAAGGGNAANATATLASAGWSGNAQTVNVTGVSAASNVIVAPAPSDSAAWAAAGVLCTAQGNGTLTFTCSTTPTSDLTANLLIV